MRLVVANFHRKTRCCCVAPNSTGLFGLNFGAAHCKGNRPQCRQLPQAIACKNRPVIICKALYFRGRPVGGEAPLYPAWQTGPERLRRNALCAK